MTSFMTTGLISVLFLSAAALPRDSTGFAASPEDALAIAAFEAERLTDLADASSDGEVYGYAGTIVFYYVAGHEQAGGSLIAVDRVCDPDPVTPGRGRCDWQYRYAALQAPLTEPALVRPPGELDLFTAYGRDCPAIAGMLGALRIGPDAQAYDIWMGSQPIPDTGDRQYRRLEFVTGPAYHPSGRIVLDGRENTVLRNLAVPLQAPLRECGP